MNTAEQLMDVMPSWPTIVDDFVDAPNIRTQQAVIDTSIVGLNPTAIDSMNRLFMMTNARGIAVDDAVMSELRDAARMTVMRYLNATFSIIVEPEALDIRPGMTTSDLIAIIQRSAWLHFVTADSDHATVPSRKIPPLKAELERRIGTEAASHVSNTMLSLMSLAVSNETSDHIHNWAMTSAQHLVDSFREN